MTVTPTLTTATDYSRCSHALCSRYWPL